MRKKPPKPALDVTLHDFASGQKIFNRYTLIKVLGRGGMGIVWLAHDDDLGRDVALKFLPEIIVHDRAIVEDLKRETKRCLELTHKNIIRIHDFVQNAISACISMEYVEGDTLSNLRADRATRIFEPDDLKPFLSQLREALDYAHNYARIIHRDLKPSNLMINKRGQLKVADFGIARSLSESVSRLTDSPGTSGTLVYMSPQQLDGKRGTHLDDIYSLGATFYELLTSKPPFHSGDINRQVHDRVPPGMTERRKDLEIEGNPIPPNWEETIAACLAKDPARRPQSVAEIVQGLLPVLPETGTTAASPKTSFKRKPVFIAGIALVFIVAGAGWYFGTRAPAEIRSTVASNTRSIQPSATPESTPTPVTMAYVAPPPPVGRTETPAVVLTESPSVAPLAPPTPSLASTPAVSDFEARSFVSSFYRTVEGKDLSSLLSLYAESVNYLDYGQRDKSFIREDYVKYYKRWPSLSFSIGDIRVSSSPSDNGATVSFEIQYSVRDPASNRSKSGRANEEWNLVKSYDGLKVTSQRETIYADAAPAVVAPSAIDSETVRQFIRNYFATLEQRDIDAALSSFDNVVNYQGTGNRNKSYIRNDLFKYLSKWTRLNFDLGTIAVSQSPDGSFAVSFNFDYTVSNISNQKRGRSSNNWVLRVNQGNLRIVSQQETVQRY